MTSCDRGKETNDNKWHKLPASCAVRATKSSCAAGARLASARRRPAVSSSQRPVKLVYSPKALWGKVPLHLVKVLPWKKQKNRGPPVVTAGARLPGTSCRDRADHTSPAGCMGSTQSSRTKRQLRRPSLAARSPSSSPLGAPRKASKLPSPEPSACIGSLRTAFNC